MIVVQGQIHSKEFEASMIGAASALGRSLPDVYREESGRLMQNLISVRTPPKRKGQGQKRVRGDILNTVTPVNERFLNVLERAHGANGFKGEHRVRGGKVMRIGYARIIRDMDELKRWHQEKRNSRTGRTRYDPTNSLYTPSKAFVPKTLFNEYVKRGKAFVGKAKGGWWAAARHVYTRRAPAAWITKRANQGSAVVNFQPGPKQTFIAINRSPWARNTKMAERAVRDAMRFRARQIPKSVDRELRRKYSAAGFIVRGAQLFAA